MAVNVKERQVAQVMGVLAQYFTSHPRGGGSGKYEEGWSDRAIAAEVNKTLAKQGGGSVSRIFVAEVRQWRLKPVTISAGPR